MHDRPYVLLSVATSIDGYIDDATDTRLLLSNDADFDRVDAVRASADAILVGANSIRRDNPRLLIRSPDRRKARTCAGKAENPTKATISAGGDLDRDARFFTTGDTPKLVYVPHDRVEVISGRLGDRAEVIGSGSPQVDLHTVLADLAGRGIGRLMVEGGGTIYTWFLTAGLVDEVHLVIAPFFIGDPSAPRFTGPGTYPQNPAEPFKLAEVQQIGQLVFLRFLTT